MNWALAFRELGWDVWITEHVRDDECTDRDEAGVSLQERFWRETVREFGFEGRECLLLEGRSPQLQPMQEFAEEADLFLNYSGQFHLLHLLPARLLKAYLDLDPAFTQLWAETCDVNMNFEGHDVFLTIGMNVNGSSACYPKAGSCRSEAGSARRAALDDGWPLVRLQRFAVGGASLRRQASQLSGA